MRTALINLAFITSPAIVGLLATAAIVAYRLLTAGVL